MAILEFVCKFATEKVKITAKPADANGNPTELKQPLLVEPIGNGTFVQIDKHVFECIADAAGDTTYNVTFPGDAIEPDQVLVHFVGADAVTSNLVGEVLPK